MTEEQEREWLKNGNNRFLIVAVILFIAAWVIIGFNSIRMPVGDAQYWLQGDARKQAIDAARSGELFGCFVALVGVGFLLAFFAKPQNAPTATAADYNANPETMTLVENNHGKLDRFTDGHMLRTGLFIGHAAEARCKFDELNNRAEPIGKIKASKTRAYFYNGDQHILTFGPIGSGKSVSCINELTAYDGSFLAIDPKGQLYATTGSSTMMKGMCDYANKNGIESLSNEAFDTMPDHQRNKIIDYAQRTIRTINPFGVFRDETSTYNPLSILDPKSPSFDTDCRTIAEGILEIKKGDHWELSALDLVALLIKWAALYEGTSDEWTFAGRNLITVRKIISLPNDARMTFFKSLEACEDMTISEGAARYAMDSKEVLDCIQTATVQLGFLRDTGIERVIKGGDDEISFSDLKKRRLGIYLIIPPDKLRTHGRFLRLLATCAMTELLQCKTEPKERVLVLLDEAAQLGRIPSIQTIASIGREYKIRLHLVFQNKPQLEEIYKGEAKSLISSAGIIQLLGANDEETVKFISERSGKVLRKRLIESTSENESWGDSSSKDLKGNGSTNKGGGRGKNIGEQYYEEAALLPDKIYGTPRGVQYLIVANRSGVMTSVNVPYWENPLVQNGVGIDPYHLEGVDINNHMHGAFYKNYIQ